MADSQSTTKTDTLSTGTDLLASFGTADLSALSSGLRSAAMESVLTAYEELLKAARDLALAKEKFDSHEDRKVQGGKSLVYTSEVMLLTDLVNQYSETLPLLYRRQLRDHPGADSAKFPDCMPTAFDTLAEVVKTANDQALKLVPVAGCRFGCECAQ